MKGVIFVTKIYAHRGSRGSFPENTMLAFEKAIFSGADGIEFDVHLTKDGEVVVIHDATLDRTTTGTGYIKDFTLEKLNHLSAGAKFTEFKNYEFSWDLERIPTLKQVLELCLPYNIFLNIELKTYEITYPDIEEKVLQVVRDLRYPDDLVIYSSFHLPTLVRLKKLDPKIKLAWLVENFVPKPLEYLEEMSWDSFHIDKKIVLKYLTYYKNIASNLRVWTVNEPLEMKQLLKTKVDAIITDYPEIAIELRDKSEV